MARATLSTDVKKRIVRQYLDVSDYQAVTANVPVHLYWGSSDHLFTSAYQFKVILCTWKKISRYHSGTSLVIVLMTDTIVKPLPNLPGAILFIDNLSIVQICCHIRLEFFVFSQNKFLNHNTFH